MKWLTQVRMIDGEWWYLDQDHQASCTLATNLLDGFRIHERETFKVWEYGPLPRKWYQRRRKGWFVVGDIRKMSEYHEPLELH